MAGAFVAVADDATASWWNPAGLASGAYLSAVLEHGQITEPRNPPVAGPAARTTTNDFAIAFPALGLSYYRLRISEVAPPGSTGSVAQNRQDPQTTGSSVRSVAISQFSSTVGQSLGEHFVLGTTGKLLHAGMSNGVATGSSPLDEADDLEISRDVHGDLDAGAMANFGRVRLGLTVRNLFEPNFGEGADAFKLKRQARVGFAVLSVPHGALQGFTAAVDADLTTTPTVMGDVRHVAAGVEGWLAKRRVGLRGGVSGETVGAVRAAGSAGVSVALKSGVFVEVSGTGGSDAARRGWAAGARVTF